MTTWTLVPCCVSVAVPLSPEPLCWVRATLRVDVAAPDGANAAMPKRIEEANASAIDLIAPPCSLEDFTVAMDSRFPARQLLVRLVWSAARPRRRPYPAVRSLGR